MYSVIFGWLSCHETRIIYSVEYNETMDLDDVMWLLDQQSEYAGRERGSYRRPSNS